MEKTNSTTKLAKKVSIPQKLHTEIGPGTYIEADGSLHRKKTTSLKGKKIVKKKWNRRDQ